MNTQGFVLRRAFLFGFQFETVQNSNLKPQTRLLVYHGETLNVPTPLQQNEKFWLEIYYKTRIKLFFRKGLRRESFLYLYVELSS